ncbi:ribokinase [Arthrobacter sp. FX8]|jgi:ribokinase|uniref:ribokinase n=1 Tax=unclassified Arthrobacter TaxID=235627 RepID=UPI0003789CB9|nr:MULTISPECIES: ribokinase [unclassified Arthrobacter]TWD47045.1 ribokinase [Arthrobacter sp. AG367]WAJ33033.1 ribokinase [Arthrobacter sp. FX8]BCW52738.1 ribokinase [Arthrobacter sp. StoSoilB19]BCW73792.1 ribokinase [Arthrobacter sp. NicSoilB11]
MSTAAGSTGRIVVVGSLNADLTIYCERLPQPGETVQGNGFAVNPGGKSANQAVAAGRLGGHVSLVGAVGKDANGAMLEASVAGAGVDVGHVRTSTEPTGVAVIAVDARGENNIIISAGANGTLSPADVADAGDVLEEAAVVSLCLEVGMDTVLAAARAGHDAGATVLLNLSPYAEIPSALAGLADVLLVNAHEAALFLGVSVPGAGAPADEWEAARERFAARGIQQVLVTLGSQGSVVLDSLASPGSRVTSVQPTQVHAVDTTGAGDAFTGAVAVRLAAGDALADAAAFASVAAALATTRKGTQAAYPDTADVERRLRAS